MYIPRPAYDTTLGESPEDLGKSPEESKSLENLGKSPEELVKY